MDNGAVSEDFGNLLSPMLVVERVRRAVVARGSGRHGECDGDGAVLKAIFLDHAVTNGAWGLRDTHRPLFPHLSGHLMQDKKACRATA